MARRGLQVLGCALAAWAVTLTIAAEGDLQTSRVACPCSLEAETLDCSGHKLDSVPRGCFLLHPSISSLILDDNAITRVEEDDFAAVGGSLTELVFRNNPLDFVHKHAFSALTLLQDLYLNGTNLEFLQPNLFSQLHSLTYVNLDSTRLRGLPQQLFSERLQGSVTLDMDVPAMALVPCATLSRLPPGSSINATSQYLWASTSQEAEECSDITSLPLKTSLCSLYGWEDVAIDCSVLEEEMTPVIAALAEAEVISVFDLSPSKMVFRAEFDLLKGGIPEDPHCLPSQIDKIYDFQVYYQHAEDVELETHYFDLADLYLFTSDTTRSVSIRAETVVLSQAIAPVPFALSISARSVILADDLLVSVSFAQASPQHDSEFYRAQHEVGTLNGVTVEKFRHGHVTVFVLQSEACLLPGAPDFSDEFDDVVSPTSLDLSLHCGYVLLEGDAEQQMLALDTATWVRNTTSAALSGEAFNINQQASDLRQRSIMALSNSTESHVVPYVTLMVYMPMVDALKENLKLFRSILGQLQDKLERNANRLFDMTLSFEERKADLQFVSDESARALQEAQNVCGSQEQKLNDLRLKTDGVYNTVFTVNDKFLAAHVSLEKDYQTLQNSIEHELHNMFLKKCKSFFRGMFRLFTGRAGVGDVVDGVNDVGRYKRELNEAKEVLTDSMLQINDMMADVETVVDHLAAIDSPDVGQSHNWTAIFPDSSPLLAVVRKQTVSKYQWEVVNDNNDIVLDDEDMKKLSGANEYRMSSNLMKDDGQCLANNIISFSKLILDIRDEEGNLKLAQLAVDQGEDKLDEVQGMLSDTETNEENYQEKMARQNLVVMNLMYDLYRKTRKDMVVMKRTLEEFCQAYFYTFFLECPDELRPRPSDGYDALLYKFSQLQFESLNSIGTLDPPPQPFTKTLLLEDRKENCTARDPLCPITTLRQQGRVDLDFSDWWGSELLSKDRVRVDRVRLYLQGTGEDFVVLRVTQPAVFNDTYLGQVYTFVGQASQCFVMYEDSAHASMSEASYNTDCSTHANYDQFYSRATPFGSYTVTPVGESVAASATAVEVLLEGSWMPRTKLISST
ncbi:uncharacterized protein LOC122248716 [Penaeus japonicus]|uniref:uncharacterized protein LOC122248716 n=1 Tax=Penaeus japonicus TaxID=27405 RepID=UPI001C71602F|nr:uncharacterized protein LOC122248716 [Penaeus japonicus]